MLSACPEIELVAAVSHGQIAVWADEQWTSIDLVIVDAADEAAPVDHFPGVAVVKRIRAVAARPLPVIAVVTGHYANDGLRHRMAAAGADFFFERAELRSREQLVELVLHPDQFRRGVPAVSDRGVPRRLGVTNRTEVDELVAYVDRHGLGPAFDDQDPHMDDSRSRTWKSHYQAIGAAAHIKPMNISTGCPPGGNQNAPSVRQLRAIYRWAARVKKTGGL